LPAFLLVSLQITNIGKIDNLIYNNKKDGVINVKAMIQKVKPDDYILSVLSPEDRLDAAFKVAGEVFKKMQLTVEDIQNSVKVVRRKTWKK